MESLELAHAYGMGTRKKVQLPIPEKETRRTLEKLGIVFGDQFDNLLIDATLPDGVVIERHPDDGRRMWLNHRGKHFATMFVKHSVYDPIAFIRMI